MMNLWKLYENIVDDPLDEANFRPVDFKKDYDNYQLPLVNDVLAYDKKKLDHIDFDKLSNDNEALSALSALKNDLEKSVKDNKRSIPFLDDFEKRFNGILNDFIKGKYTKATNSINKAPYSGYNHAPGVLEEHLIAYLYNEKDPTIQYEDISNNYEVGLNNFVICKSIADNLSTGIKNDLKTNTPDDYVAIHVSKPDKKDFPKNSNLNYEDYENIAKLFQGKKSAGKLIGIKNLSGMYVGSSKDMWNKADILLINDNDPKNIFVNMTNSLSDSNNPGLLLNQRIYDEISNNQILPLSLKLINMPNGIKLTKCGKVGNVNYVSSDNVSIVFSNGFEKGTSNSMYLSCDGCDYIIQFRTRSTVEKNISIELKNVKYNEVNYGKSTKLLMNELNLNANADFYQNVTSADVITWFNNNKNITYDKNININAIADRPIVKTLVEIHNIMGKTDNKDVFKRIFNTLCKYSINGDGSSIFYRVDPK